jgi:hypothetical protein
MMRHPRSYAGGGDELLHLLDHAIGEVVLLGVAGHMANGKTAIEGLSGSGSGAGSGGTMEGARSRVSPIGMRNTFTGRAIFLTCCSPDPRTAGRACRAPDRG